MERLVLGPRAVLEAVRAAPGRLAVIYLAKGAGRALGELAAEARAAGVRLDEREPSELDALARGGKHQGVVGIGGEYVYASLEALLLEVERPLLVALDEITDPHNLGAIVRSAVALGADGVITLKDRAAPVTPIVVRASAGATEHARIMRVTNLARTLAALGDAGLDVVGLDADGDVRVTELGPAPAGRVLVVGSEGSGLRPLVRKQCTRVASIELEGPVASLNASVAAGIAIHAAIRSMRS